MRNHARLNVSQGDPSDGPSERRTANKPVGFVFPMAVMVADEQPNAKAFPAKKRRDRRNVRVFGYPQSHPECLAVENHCHFFVRLLPVKRFV
jgi:hypothetical protein